MTRAKTGDKDGKWNGTGFGARLKELRESSGLSQGQLAEKAGVHNVTISKLERGTQEPAWPLVLILARILGISCDEFREPQDQPKDKRVDRIIDQVEQFARKLRSSHSSEKS